MKPPVSREKRTRECNPGTFKLSNDPQFTGKLRDVVGLYLNPPERRRLRQLEWQGLIRIQTQVFRGRCGRPEGLGSLSEDGGGLLLTRRIAQLGTEIQRATADGIRCLQHLLLVNDLRVQLVQMRQVVPAVTVTFLSPPSPFLERTHDDRPVVRESFQVEGDAERRIEFTPDGVFGVAHAVLGKTLLFFLEVDGSSPRWLGSIWLGGSRKVAGAAGRGGRGTPGSGGHFSLGGGNAWDWKPRANSKASCPVWRRRSANSRPVAGRGRPSRTTPRHSEASATGAQIEGIWRATRSTASSSSTRHRRPLAGP